MDVVGLQGLNGELKTSRRLFLISLLMLLPSLLLGCIMPTEGYPKLAVHGNWVGTATSGHEGKQISVYFCNRKSQRVVTTDTDGQFSEALGYVSGGFFMIFPPLGDFPKQTPPPPTICVSFPSEPGAYYSISLSRESTSWRMFDINTGNPADIPMFIPVLVKADLEESNKRGLLNDWVLRLQFTK